MICPTCGTELRDGVLMCPICGTKQIVPPPRPPQTVQQTRRRFSKTRIASVLFVILVLALGLWRVFFQ
ncbi:zinc-ribbon domain-containing protein [uncultured Megasphaera sp.]|uniref:zinc ribbon domain-containing protein n=1 Tax=uncultured Megasphaera sp. TaxID=165188 RepID=UPI002659ADF3|nr:zinc-ribbon domain-containing protein [uncultured Megasphaera sp.]